LRHGLEHRRIDNIDFGGVASKFRFGTVEFKIAQLANNTTASIATDKPFATKRLVACQNGYAFRCLLKTGDSDKELVSEVSTDFLLFPI